MEGKMKAQVFYNAENMKLTHSAVKVHLNQSPIPHNIFAYYYHIHELD